MVRAPMRSVRTWVGVVAGLILKFEEQKLRPGWGQKVYPNPGEYSGRRKGQESFLCRAALALPVAGGSLLSREIGRVTPPSRPVCRPRLPGKGHQWLRQGNIRGLLPTASC